jgi:hypothetical protein
LISIERFDVIVFRDVFWCILGRRFRLLPTSEFKL